jgi:hypothetical protein
MQLADASVTRNALDHFAAEHRQSIHVLCVVTVRAEERLALVVEPEVLGVEGSREEEKNE